MANPSDKGVRDPAGPGAEPLTPGAAAPSATSMASGASSSGSTAGRSTQASRGGSSLGAGLKETAQTAADAVRQQATQLAGDVGHELNKTRKAQITRGVEAIRQVARAIDSAASGAGEPVADRSPARSTKRLAASTACRTIFPTGTSTSLINSAARLARSQPALFFGGSVAAGFAFARFLKSSARQRQSVRYDPYPALGKPMATRETTRPLVSLMTHVASDLAYLVQTEFRLARAEIGEKLSSASNAAVYLGIGGVIALAGFIVLLFDIAQWITVAGLAVCMEPVDRRPRLARDRRRAGDGGRRSNEAEPTLVPSRTLEQVREDYVVAKEHVR